MANFMITSACNLRCEYCFAMDFMRAKGSDTIMTMELFRSILDWVDRSNIETKTIQLIGGEPTLSPLLLDKMEEIERRGHRAVIFSNGTILLSKKIIAATHDNGSEWVINANDPCKYSPVQVEALTQNLERLQQHAYLTFNVYSADFTYDHIFQYIEKYDIRPHVKLGIALPTYAKQNEYVSSDLFAAVRKRLSHFFSEAAQKKVTIATECGVPYCLLNDLQNDFPDVFVDLISHCGSRLDIAPDGTLINCLPLSKTATVKYDQFTDYLQAIKWFHDFLEPYKSLTSIMDDCFGCQMLRDGQCSVCLSNSLDQYNKLVYPPLPPPRVP